MKELPIKPAIGHAHPLNVKVYMSVNGSLQVLTFWAWPCHHLVLDSGWSFGCSLLKHHCFRLRHLRPRSASWDLVQVEQNITSQSSRVWLLSHWLLSLCLMMMSGVPLPSKLPHWSWGDQPREEWVICRNLGPGSSVVAPLWLGLGWGSRCAAKQKDPCSVLFFHLVSLGHHQLQAPQRK